MALDARKVQVLRPVPTLVMDNKQIDDDAYNRQYQKLNRELTDLKIQKHELDKNKLKQTKDISKMTVVKDIIGDRPKLLSAFR